MNWHDRIAAAEQRGRFTAEDLKLARQWVTCACGEQDERIPRNSIGMPFDGRLRYYGTHFPVYVERNDFVSARECLLAINKHATRVLREVAYDK